MRALVLLVSLAAAGACGAPAAISGPPPPSTSAKLVDGGCGAAGPRTEIALGVEHGAAWAVVGGERVYTTSRECFALAAIAAPQKVTLRARADGGQGGVGITARVSHAGREALALACGDPGRCTASNLRQWGATRPRADACSGVLIRSLRWDTAGGDGVSPDDIEVTFEIVPEKIPDTCHP